MFGSAPKRLEKVRYQFWRNAANRGLITVPIHVLDKMNVRKQALKFSSSVSFLAF